MPAGARDWGPGAGRSPDPASPRVLAAACGPKRSTGHAMPPAGARARAAAPHPCRYRKGGSPAGPAVLATVAGRAASLPLKSTILPLLVAAVGTLPAPAGDAPTGRGGRVLRAARLPGAAAPARRPAPRARGLNVRAQGCGRPAQPRAPHRRHQHAGWQRTNRVRLLLLGSRCVQKVCSFSTGTGWGVHELMRAVRAVMGAAREVERVSKGEGAGIGTNHRRETGRRGGGRSTARRVRTAGAAAA